jgi:hypothetical protein
MQVSGDGAVGGFPADRLEWETSRFTPLTIPQVLARRRRGNSLVVLSVTAFGPSGQGMALNAAYAAAKVRPARYCSPRHTGMACIARYITGRRLPQGTTHQNELDEVAGKFFSP